MLGHNNPPISERLEIDYESLAAHLKEIVDDNTPFGSLVTADDAAGWSRRASAVKAALKVAEDFRKKEKAPITQAGKDVEAFFAKLVEGAEKLAAVLVADINAYQRAQLAEQRRKQAEAEAAARREAAAFDEPTPAPAAPVAAKDAGRVASLGTVKASASIKWKGEVTDPTLLPRQYLMPNQAAIDAAVAGGVREIPGVRIFEDIRTAIR